MKNRRNYRGKRRIPTPNGISPGTIFRNQAHIRSGSDFAVKPAGSSGLANGQNTILIGPTQPLILSKHRRKTTVSVPRTPILKTVYPFKIAIDIPFGAKLVGGEVEPFSVGPVDATAIRNLVNISRGKDNYIVLFSRSSTGSLGSGTFRPNYACEGVKTWSFDFPIEKPILTTLQPQSFDWLSRTLYGVELGAEGPDLSLDPGNGA